MIQFDIVCTTPRLSSTIRVTNEYCTTDSLVSNPSAMYHEVPLYIRKLSVNWRLSSLIRHNTQLAA